jgi:hypothetical protein
MALAAGGDSIPDKVIDWLVAQPCADATSPGFGGFGFSPGGCEDVDPDSTALAVLGLIQANVLSKTGSTIDNAVEYLASIQDSSGGFVSPMAGVNANTTGLVVSALNAAFETPHVTQPSLEDIDKAQAYLLSLTFRCNTSAELMGAIAYSAPALMVSPLDGATEAALVASTAQGMPGLSSAVIGQRGNSGSWGTGLCSQMGEPGPPETASQPPQIDPSQSGTPSDQASDTGQSNTAESSAGIPGWAWIVGSLVVLVIIVVGGVLIVRPKKQ